MKRWVIGFAIVLGVVGLAGCFKSYERPKYKVLRKEAGWELREYEPYLVAETTVISTFENAGDKAFGVLAGYITGQNKTREDIAMTAPVDQRQVSEDIAMTVPVSQQAVGDAYAISFMMPSKYSMETLPLPNDPRVKLREVGPRLVAARAYSGSWSGENYARNEKALRLALAQAGLKEAGEPILARYNPPWTPPFMRLNEVLIPVARTD